MDLELVCPHCQEYFIVNQKQINCGIFRHAVFITNGHPINPHMPKQECENLLNKNLVYGCAKPFRVNLVGNKYVTEICDYI
jgi:hypothetical protein